MDLDVSSRVDLVNPVTWRSASLTVQVVTLDEDGVVAKATHPDVPLPPTFELDAPPNMEPAGRDR